MRKDNDFRNRLLEMIDKSDMNNKDVWTDVAAAILEYEDKKYSDLSGMLNKRYLSDNNNWNIHVLLHDNANRDLPNGYSYVSEADDIRLCGYLDCSYEVSKEIYHKTFKGCCKDANGEKVSFEYQLIQSDALLYDERMLYKFAILNEVEVPVIYAPLFRRFVEIVPVDQNFDLDNKTLDLDLEQDALLNKVLKLNCRAIWNVMISDNINSDKQEIKGDVRRLTEMVYRHVFSVSDNSYILFDNKRSCEYDILRGENEIIVTTEKDVLDNVKKLVINQPLSRRFKHSFDTSISLPERVRTESDIYNIINRFKFDAKDVQINSGYDGDSIRIEEILTSSVGIDNNIVICEYDRRYRYEENYGIITPDKARSKAVRSMIRVIFVNDANEELYDRIVYIMSWLRNHYPEFDWEGGYRK